MSFFDVPHQLEEEREPEPPPPEWAGPPPGVIPGVSPQRVEVFRTGRACLVVQHFRAYPTGVEFTLTLYLRSGEDRPIPPWELRSPAGPARPLPDDFLRIGVLFPDGAKWTNVGHLRFDESPRPPVVLARGGGGGDDRLEFRYWMWPLPPDGPLTVVAEWPAHGVAETRALVDGAALRRAAADAEVLWPEHRP